MIDHRIINIETGKPVELPVATKTQSYEELHAEYCDNVRIMLENFRHGFKSLMKIGGDHDKLLRSVRWYDEGGVTYTIPVMLRQIKSDLEWLEKFFAREHR
jgi:hypothetical protein